MTFCKDKLKGKRIFLVPAKNITVLSDYSVFIKDKKVKTMDSSRIKSAYKQAIERHKQEQKEIKDEIKQLI